MLNRRSINLLWVWVILIITGCAPVETVVPGSDVETGGRSALQTVTNPAVTTPVNGRRQALETLFALACLDRTTLTKHDKIIVRWADTMTTGGEMAIRIMRDGRIYGETHATVTAGTVLDLGHAYQLPQGDYQVVLMPTPGEYHVGGPRIDRRIAVTVWPRQEEPIQVESQC